MSPRLQHLEAGFPLGRCMTAIHITDISWLLPLSVFHHSKRTLRLGGLLGDAWQASILLTRCGHYHYKSFTMVREPWGWVATWAMYEKHPYYWRKVVIFIICLSPSTLRLGDHLGDARPSARDYSAGDAFRQQGAHPGADDIIVLWLMVSGIS